MLVLLLLGGAAYFLLGQASASDRVVHTDAVRLADSELLMTLVDAESGARGFAVTGDPSFLGPYDDALRRWPGQLEAVRRLTSDDPRQRDRVDDVERSTRAQLDQLGDTVGLRRAGAPSYRLLASMKRGAATMDATWRAVADVDAQEVRLRTQRARKAEVALRWTFASLFGGAVAFVVLAGAAWAQRREVEQRRARAEEKAALSAQLEIAYADLDALFKNAPVGLAMFDRDLRYRRINQQLANINGLAIEQHIGKRIGEVLPGLPADLEARLGRVCETGEPLLDEEVRGETRARPGVVRTFNTSHFPVARRDGTIVGVGVVVADVTEARAAAREQARLRDEVEEQRARLHDLVMQTPVAISMFEGAELRFTLTNPAYQAMIGGRDVVGRDLFGVYPELRGQPVAQAMLDTLRTGASVTLVDNPVSFRGAHDAIEERFFTTSVRPMRDPSGGVVGVVCSGIEVTDQVRARRALEASLHFVEQFIGILGHDLRNPLNAVKMAAHLLQTRRDEAQAKYVQRILSSADRMARMIEQILDLARSRLGGGIPIDRRPTDVAAVIGNVVDEFQTAHPEREIAWRPASGVVGNWDRDRLAQVLSNLIGNAIEYGDPSRPVTVSLDPSAESVAIGVHSHGPPIPPELIPEIFDPYRRGARAAKSKGLGLGLFISEQIVLAHRGTVSVLSAEGGGTTFTVSLPRDSVRDLSPSTPLS